MQPPQDQYAALWHAVADGLQRDVDAGLRHLLNEDWLRASAIRALVAIGTAPRAIRIEEPSPGGGRIDLVLRGHGADMDVEFKFPREPRATNAADTMAVGSVIADLARLAHQHTARRIAVHLLEERFVGHLRRRTDVALLVRPGQELVITPEMAMRLPKSAIAMYDGRFPDRPVTAICTLSRPIGDLVLQVLDVQ